MKNFQGNGIYLCDTSEADNEILYVCKYNERLYYCWYGIDEDYSREAFEVFSIKQLIYLEQ